jgi:carbon storage regulator
MLVLSRKEGEQIVVAIGDRQVVIRIVDCRRGKVRIGVSAPADVTVHREEIWSRRASWHEPARDIRQAAGTVSG